MAAVLTTIDQTIGRVIDSAAIDYDSLAIRFTDGSYILLEVDPDGRAIEVGNPRESCEQLLVDIGVITEEEHKRLKKQREDRSIAEYREARRKQYEQLKQEFETG